MKFTNGILNSSATKLIVHEIILWHFRQAIYNNMPAESTMNSAQIIILLASIMTQWRHMVSRIFVNIVSINGLLPIQYQAIHYRS